MNECHRRVTSKNSDSEHFLFKKAHSLSVSNLYDARVTNTEVTQSETI